MLWLFDKMLTYIPVSLNNVLIRQFDTLHFLFDFQIRKGGIIANDGTFRKAFDVF